VDEGGKKVIEKPRVFARSLARLDAVADHLALLRGAVRDARAQQVAGQV
jgi:hypothetical protein